MKNEFSPKADSLARTVIEQLTKAPPIGEARERELLKDAHSFIYYTSPDGELPAHFYFPPGHGKDSPPAPAVIFFHGGLWDASMPTQFIPHCHHFSTRGAVTLTVEYRVRTRHGTGPVQALEDAIMATVFLKKNARILGIDPEKIVVAGAGSGGHLALALATLPSVGSKNCDEYRPAAVFAYSAIVNTTARGIGSDRFPSLAEARLYSPSEHLRKGLPPCYLFHGKVDRVVPEPLAAKFARRYSRKKNRCEFMPFEAAGHTFFNYNSHQRNFEITTRAADYFLVELGLLEPDPLAGEF